MMKTLSLLFALSLTFLSQELHADYPYYFFKPGQIQITHDQYRRYIRPQISNIVNEYYSLLRKLEPRTADAIELKEKVLALSKLWMNYSKSRCPGENDCHEKRERIYKQARLIDGLTLKLQEKSIIASPGTINEAFLDSEINLTRSTDELSLLVYRLNHLLEENHLFEETPFAHFNNSRRDIGDAINQLKISTELLVTQKLSPLFKDDFDRLWNGYIVVLEQDVLDQVGPEELIRNMGILNVCWNTFHMKMTKGSEQFPRALVAHINTMHNRWNSFLKIALRD